MSSKKHQNKLLHNQGTVLNDEEYDEYLKLKKMRKVNPSQYSKKVRFYCDIDGVFLPFKTYSNPIPETADTKKLKLDLYVYNPNFVRLYVERETHVFNNSIEKLVELSKHPDIDFVWLTAWRENAALLDDNFGVKSIGYLPWEKKMSDYAQVFKKTAIEEDQEKYPSRFIWLDDVANKIHYDDPLFYKYEDINVEPTEIMTEKDRYLSINTKSHLGVTVEELNKIESWVNKIDWL